MKRESIGKNTIRRKLRSDAGASITFALFLFLICAVASAIILVAATTASGRMANVATTDQRYSTVTSAVELIKDQLANKSVSVMTVNGREISISKPMNEVTEQDILEALEKASAGDDDDTTLAFPDDGDDYTPINRPKIKGDTSETKQFANKIAELCVADSGDSYVFELGFKVTTDEIGNNEVSEKLRAKADVKIDEDDNVTFLVSNDNNLDPFEMTLRFTSSTQNASPAVSADLGVENSKEISWHLERALTTYDDAILKAEKNKIPDYGS